MAVIVTRPSGGAGSDIISDILPVCLFVPHFYGIALFSVPCKLTPRVKHELND